MDKIDRTLLWELCKNCRVSYETLAKSVSLSPNAVKNRVQNLIDNGVVHQFYVVLGGAAFGGDFFQATVLTDGSEDVAAFVNEMGKDPRVAHISLLASITGGAYLVWGQYIGLEDLNNLGVFLRSMETVTEVELYTLISSHDPMDVKIGNLTKLNKKVLRCLIDNPRMSISDIADCSGYSAKSVRRALKEFEENSAIWFGARPDLAAGSLVNVHVRIEWNEKDSSAEEIGYWLKNEYPVTLWDAWRTVHHPVLYAEFVVDDLNEAQTIVLNIRNSLKIKSTSTLVAYSNAKFPYLADIKLRELIDMK